MNNPWNKYAKVWNITKGMLYDFIHIKHLKCINHRDKSRLEVAKSWGKKDMVNDYQWYKVFSGGNKSGLELRHWWWLYNFADIGKPTELYTLKGEFYVIYISVKKRDFKNLYIEIFLDLKWCVLPPWSGSFDCSRTGFFPTSVSLGTSRQLLVDP